MNERIRELAEQANEKIRYRIDPNTFKHIDDSNGPHTRFEFNKEKFAELIYNDIITVVGAAALLNHSALDVLKNLKRLYEGVEE